MKILAPLLLLLIVIPCFLHAQDSDADAAALAKQTQNPISTLVSLPFQNNLDFNFGPNKRHGNVINIQPVWPFSVGKVNLINRTILPVKWWPDVTSESGGDFGLGDLNHSLFIGPSKPMKITFAAGPILFFPTATDNTLGTGKWSAGPSFVMLGMPGSFVMGVLVSNVWSYAGPSDRADVNFFLLQYFINYNLPKAWYLTTAPIVTSNWEATEGNKWLVPFGGGVGKIFSIGKQKINFNTQAYYYAVQFDALGGPNWGMRFQLQFLFPKKPKDKGTSSRDMHLNNLLSNQ